MRTFSIAFLLLFCQTLLSQNGGHFGGPVPATKCITKMQYEEIRARILDVKTPKTGVIIEKILFDDPMGNGGMNSFGKTIVNYVDLDTSNALLDYNCGQITYDGHQGADAEILNFYEMDEGVPMLCAAPGVVVYSHDGEYDRNTEWISGTTANAIIVSHSDGSTAWYFHMRKNTVAVVVGDTVAVGDTLGFVGSSGFSSGPHIHFEVQQNGTFFDPFDGSCQSDSSRWINQGDYVLDLPFEVMDHGLTTIPLSWAMISERPPTKTHVKAPGPIYSWTRLRNVRKTDTLTWKFYANGSFWNQYSFSPNDTYSSSWWYIWWNLPTSSTYYGNWTLKIYRNNDLIAEQNFTYDNQDNQMPTIQNLVFNINNNEKLNGEFIATDPDGSIFWYEITSYPKYGTLEQFGGRKRKFAYTPSEEFVGLDTVIFYAIDDENFAGENGLYVFNVLEGLTIAESIPHTPSDFSLLQNYPNPFNPITTLRYNLPEETHVVLTVYNILGREITTLVNKTEEPGLKTVRWDATDEFGQPVSAGIYLYRITTRSLGQNDNFTQTRKMILMK